MEPSLIDRFEALEHQTYLMYLQLNAITRFLLDSGVIDKEQVGLLMDELHNEIQLNAAEPNQVKGGKGYVYS